MNKINWFWLCK